MAVKKRTKIAAEFNMSSMTDIIFLLLIFFMLTSSLVAPNAIFLRLPGTSAPPKQVSTKKSVDIGIDNSGLYSVNGRTIDLTALETELAVRKEADSELSITISPEDDTPTEAVVAIMDITVRLGVDALLTPPAKE
jgi:biopolymer transport protein ExbD